MDVVKYTLNGIEYLGPHCIGPNGKPYTGNVYVFGISKSLKMLENNIVPVLEEYSILNPEYANRKNTYGVDYYPSPVKEDYNKGYINRYFLQKINEPLSEVLEVEDKIYDKVEITFYNKVMVEWTISENNIREKNEKEIIKASQEIKNISSKLNNTLELTDIINDIGYVYTENEEISTLNNTYNNYHLLGYSMVPLVNGSLKFEQNRYDFIHTNYIISDFTPTDGIGVKTGVTLSENLIYLIVIELSYSRKQLLENVFGPLPYREIGDVFQVFVNTDYDFSRYQNYSSVKIYGRGSYIEGYPLIIPGSVPTINSLELIDILDIIEREFDNPQTTIQNI